MGCAVTYSDRTVNLHFLFQPVFISTAYYIAKELLMTERTYKKDLEIITVVSSSLYSIPYH